MLAAAALSHYDGVGPGEAVGSEHTLTSPPLVSCFRPPLRESTEYLYCTRTFVQFIENIEHMMRVQYDSVPKQALCLTDQQQKSPHHSLKTSN